MKSITQTSGDARELITPLLRKMVHRLDPSTRLVVSYHLGWCDVHSIPANANGGNAIRSADRAELVRQGGSAWAAEEAGRRAVLAEETVAHAGAAQDAACQVRALARYLIDREA